MQVLLLGHFQKANKDMRQSLKGSTGELQGKVPVSLLAPENSS